MAPITGRKVFATMALAFGIIISVNLLLAYSAVKTFPGLEVRNSYVASQSFDADRAAQQSLGWSVSAEVEDGALYLNITDEQGRPVEVASLDGTYGRATSVRDDQTPEFVFDGMRYVAPVDTAPGNWNLRMVAEATDGTAFRQRVIVRIKG